MRPIALLAVLIAAVPAFAADSVLWNGFALLRPETSASGVPLNDESVSAQIQAGLDWRPSVLLGAHLHVLARNENDGSRRGRAGVVEAFLEQNLNVGAGRVHLMEGAFFLPTSRENIDSLWASPYTISSSALNTWLGEELRPVGIDASYMRRLPRASAVTAGATVFRGNDTFGALPAVRGWTLGDRWTLLGEHAVVNDRFFTSVSAETDGRVGWSGRTKWNNRHATVQFTRVDNRADALRYGELFNWATRFNILGGDYTRGDWTLVSELGWGTTAIQGRRRVSDDIQARYALLSRRIANFRASVRFDQYATNDDEQNAYTAALFWEPRGRLRTGIEGIRAGDEKRVALELRYSF